MLADYVELILTLHLILISNSLKKSLCVSFHHTALMTACVTVSLKGHLITLCQQNLAISDSDVQFHLWLDWNLSQWSPWTRTKWIWSTGLQKQIVKLNINLLKVAWSGQMLSLSAQSVFRPALISRSVENIKLLKTASLPRFCKSVNLWALHIDIRNGSKSNNKWMFEKKAFVNIEWHKTHTHTYISCHSSFRWKMDRARRNRRWD